MQTIILNHYPPAVKQIKEIQQIAKAEDIEFAKLNASTKKVIQNMFVITADEAGVRRFEKLLGIKPKAAQSLEDRKMYIISKTNNRKMSISELEVMLAQWCKSVRLLCDANAGEIIVQIEESTISIDMIDRMLEEILPVNVYYSFTTKIRNAAANKMIAVEKIGAQLRVRPYTAADNNS